MLTEEQRLKRYGKIGASIVPYLMVFDEKKVMREWMRLVGHPEYVDDTAEDWVAYYGSHIEKVALDWHEIKTGEPLVHRGQWMNHPELPHVGCTLDAFRVVDRTVIDCKALNYWRWREAEEAVAFYTAQVVVQKACTKAANAALLLTIGGLEPVEHACTWDEAYEAQVWERIRWFWGRVESLQPPVALPDAKAPVPATRSVDMTGSNEWASYAGAWLGNQEAASAFNAATKALKGMVPKDAVKTWGHGIQVNRSKAGSLTIKEVPQ